MDIIILDGHALNPGDLTWDAFKTVGNVSVFDRTPEPLVSERIGNAEIVITNKVPITEEIMQKCPNIKYIGVLATGYNIIDLKAAAKHNIIVTNIPSYSTKAVAQAVFALLLEMTNGVHDHNDSVQQGEWCKVPDFCYWTHPITELSGKTFGIIGFGDIGQTVAKIALAMGMNVIAYTRSVSKIECFNKKYSVLSENENQEAVKNVSLEELFSLSDVISIHCPLTDSTKNMINEKALDTMKTGAYIINTSRGPVVDESAVRHALINRKLAGFACDVISSEPMDANNPLKGAPRCIITPHVAWAAKETRMRLLNIAVENLKNFLAGTPVNIVL